MDCLVCLQLSRPFFFSHISPWSAIMPRTRPQLSITLPRNFTFHYTEGEEPRTPEHEVPLPLPPSPPRATTYRVKKRIRPSVTSLFQTDNDMPIPTIEVPAPNVPTKPLFQHRATEPVDGYLAPTLGPKFMTMPRTPSPHQRQAVADWDSSSKDIGESIIRPLSACSLLSDSSDASSSGSLTSYPAGDGSCTSPESDAPDPFKSASIKKGKSREWAAMARNEVPEGNISSKKPHVSWTSEMDKHLWSTYHIYLQDPTVTPFKMLPGVAPPLGICHRVAREARRSWRGAKSKARKSSEFLSPFGLKVEATVASNNGVPGSPDTVRAIRSGSNTPTGVDINNSSVDVWPKSGSSTRRRLRCLCKRKPSIAPHYQRLLQSRSPSPFSSSSPRNSSRSQSRLSEVTSPFQPQSSPFNTRDIQLSLTTSTSATMQPNGPLAQLASSNGSSANVPPNTEWFNEPPVPWASPTAIPSDIDTTADMNAPVVPMQSPRLGSPFGYHTWGPSRSRQRARPSTSRMLSSDAATIGPSLRSPLRMHDSFPYPGISGVQKRRARLQLEDELSPGGSNREQNLLDSLLNNHREGRHRRVRSRGFSLGDMQTSNSLENMFTPPNDDQMRTPLASNIAALSSGTAEPTTPTEPRRLASPFNGIAPRLTRSRHMATMSLGAYEPFSSIGETLGQSMDISPIPSQSQETRS